MRPDNNFLLDLMHNKKCFWSISKPSLSLARFLDASTHLYKMLCPSMETSVHPSVHPSAETVERLSLGSKFPNVDMSSIRPCVESEAPSLDLIPSLKPDSVKILIINCRHSSALNIAQINPFLHSNERYLYLIVSLLNRALRSVV